jgi:hypothetical protein
MEVATELGIIERVAGQSLGPPQNDPACVFAMDDFATEVPLADQRSLR